MANQARAETPLADAMPATPQWQVTSRPGATVERWQQVATTRRPYQLVRAEITIAAPILPLLKILQDARQQGQWFPYTEAVTVLEQPAPNQTLVQFQTQSRWPFKARDAITLFTVTVTSARQLRIDMYNQPQQRPALPGYLRIQQASGYWQLSALDQCQTRVRYEAGSRWGGLVPQWLVDQTNARLAEETLLNLQRWAASHYQDYKDEQQETGDHDDLHRLSAHRQCR